ncbi:type III secretion system protein PrgE [Lactococcus petauri]|uniref:type III secretion system protein PrgE n=1 Tax=Lactococcus petauri TaxID=1940789 RepID=UPI0018ABDAE3|nr:type III secretion system protein PrgE [Lactococcus petauri]MDC0826548.1 type III secretion system protein PrgE [Lactococcus petauri]
MGSYKKHEGVREKKEHKIFAEGVHEGTIKFVKLTKSSSGSDMMSLLVDGKEGEGAFYNLTFSPDNIEASEDFMNYILSSIEDNGVEIPDLDFGYNKETVQFLKDKAVYIRIKQTTYKGKVDGKIEAFLNQEEFDDEEWDEELD